MPGRQIHDPPQTIAQPFLTGFVVPTRVDRNRLASRGAQRQRRRGAAGAVAGALTVSH